LLEEDLEAALKALLLKETQHHPLHPRARPPPRTNGDAGTEVVSASASASSPTGPTSTSATVPPPIGPPPVTAATLLAAAKRDAGTTGPDTTTTTTTTTEHKTKQVDHQDQDKAATTASIGHVHPNAAHQVTPAQERLFQSLLQQHYQLLIQQAILSIRCANSNSKKTTHDGGGGGGGVGVGGGGNEQEKEQQQQQQQQQQQRRRQEEDNFFWSGENDADLCEVLDLAVTMLQDLDQHRKDSIRTAILQQQLMTRVGHHQQQQQQQQEPRPGRQSPTSTTKKTTTGSGGTESGTNCDDGGLAKSKGQRTLLSEFQDSVCDVIESEAPSKSHLHPPSPSPPPSDTDGRRLTRAAFQRLQARPMAGSRRMAFDVPGLLHLNETFSTIDRSVLLTQRSSGKRGTAGHFKDKVILTDKRKDDAGDDDDDDVGNDDDGGGDTLRGETNSDNCNILMAPTHAQACRYVLEEAGASVEESFLPGVVDCSENFSSIQEVFDDDSFRPPCTAEQEQYLRRNRNLFTSGEDNLVMRGVNLYGEKQWILIADRYLPDRSVNIVSQRYSKICLMMYKANGIQIDEKGNLAEPPKLESVDDIDEEQMKVQGLKLVDPPAVLNVHRWSLEEDLTLLKAVPIMGNM
jgi:hypothetical protein